jgi:hypothetical protein
MITRRRFAIALVVAVLVFGIEGFVLDGWVLALLSFTVPVALLVSGRGDKSPALVLRDRRGLLLLGLWVTMMTGVLAVGEVNERLAQASAAKIGEACVKHRRAVGEFPAKLTDLVPSYLPTVPHGKWVLGSRWNYFRPKGGGDLYPRLCLASWGYGGGCFDFARNVLREGPSW